MALEQSTAEPPIATPTGTTLASSVYERLRQDILNGSLAPGEKLRSEFLRQRYSAGISPVREALNRLVSDRLVCKEDQKGFHVALVSRADLEELIRTRCLIEENAIRESIRLGDDAWEEQIVLAFHRLSRVPRSADQSTFDFNPEWAPLHRDFHRSIIAACGSQRLIDFCELLTDQADRYRQLAAAISYPDRQEGEEHRAIMQAALERDADTTVRLQQAHIRKTAEFVFALATKVLGE